MAAQITRLIGARFGFDTREFMAEEYADAGLWQSEGTVFRAVKGVERKLVLAADAIVALTEKAQMLLHEWYPLPASRKTIEVIPCCVDLRLPRNGEVRLPVRRDALGHGDRLFVFVYVGNLGGWYLTEAMTDFVATARDRLGSLRWRVWTQIRATQAAFSDSSVTVASKATLSSIPPLQKRWRRMSLAAMQDFHSSSSAFRRQYLHRPRSVNTWRPDCR